MTICLDYEGRADVSEAATSVFPKPQPYPEFMHKVEHFHALGLREMVEDVCVHAH